MKSGASEPPVTNRQRTGPRPKTPRNIKWPADLWDQVLRATDVIKEREQIEILPSEFVRRAVRKEVRSVLGQVAA